MIETGIEEPGGLGAELTDKHREVLDRLLEHKSSKEIAIELGISPKTVDQRINSAARKLGTADRRETARAYGNLRQAWERTPYPYSYIPPQPSSGEDSGRETEAAAFSLGDSQYFPRQAPWEIAPSTILPGMFHGPSGTVSRLAAILVLAAAMLVTALVGLGVAQALTELIRAG
ncbi:MAG: helix-turn-helix transcriptional regulator [Novosphingobium sp.]